MRMSLNGRNAGGRIGYVAVERARIGAEMIRWAIFRFIHILLCEIRFTSSLKAGRTNPFE